MSNPNSSQSKLVIDGLAANAFRVVGVGQDVVLESFYLYPNLGHIASLEAGQSIEFNMDPDPGTEPNIRLIMSRAVATRLATALVDTLGLAREADPPADQ